VKKILLIDDDPELRQLLATYLGRHGFDTLLLPDTRQLDAFLERYQPQLLILDLMPTVIMMIHFILMRRLEFLTGMRNTIIPKETHPSPAVTRLFLLPPLMNRKRKT
jgi:DNA-binding response OmpR family regulator